MSAENQKQPNSSDEMDMTRLFSSMGYGISQGWRQIIRFLAIIRRVPLENKFSFIGIIVASLVIGVSYHKFFQSKYYESSMVFSSDYLNKRLVESMVEKLNILANEKDARGLARALNLPDSSASNIRAFKASPFVAETDVIELEVLKEQLRNTQAAGKNEKIIDEVIERIEIENRHAYEITVRTTSSSVIPNLQEAILTYFKNNPYIQKRIDINRKNMVEKQQKLKSDVRKLDSLKIAMIQNYNSMAEGNKRSSNTMIVSEDGVAKPMDVYTKDLQVYKLYQEATEIVFLEKDFEVVDGFTQFSEPASIGTSTVVLLSLIIGVTIAYAEVGLRSLNSYLATIE